MKIWSLRTKILLSVGCIIFIVLGTSAMIHIHDLRQDYLEALTWRSEALAQDIINEITKMRNLGLEDIEDMFPPLALRCLKLYEFNREKNVAHFAVIDPAGMIGPHNDSTLWNTPITNQLVLHQFQLRKQGTVLADDIYHTLVPVFGEEDTYLATIDIGTPKRVVDEKVQRLFVQSLVLFVFYLFLAFVTISLLMHVLLTKPVSHLVMLGEQLAAGNLVRIPRKSGPGDEVAILSSAFNRISLYLQHVAAVATAISTGDLRGHILPRSSRDVLGTAFQRMTAYLDRLAAAATTIANGDLQQDVQPESAHDVLGNAFHTMAVQLRENFEKIQQEVAERTRAQEALQHLNEELERRVEERTAELAREKYILETFMNTVPDRIYFKDREGRITNANNAHAKEFGFSEPGKEIGKTAFDLLPEELARMTFEQEQEIIRTGEPLLDREFPLPQSDGSVHWSLVTKMPLRDEKGEIIGTFGISRDITSQKQARASLEQAYAEILSLNHQLQEDALRYCMRALLVGAPPSVGRGASLTTTVRETWNAPYFCVVLLKLLPVSGGATQSLSASQQSGGGHAQQQPARAIMNHLIRTYEQYHRDLPLSGVFSQITDTEAALILNPDEQSQVRELCAWIVSHSEALLQEYAYTLVFGIGEVVHTPEELHVSYDTAQQAIWARDTVPHLQMLSSADLYHRKREVLMYSFPVEKEQQLSTAVIAGQHTLVREIVQDIVAQNALEQSSYQKLMGVYNHFLQTAAKILAQSPPVQDTGSPELPLMQTFRAAKPETLQDFQDRLDELLRQLLTLYTRQQKHHADAVTQKIFRYLDRHYADPALSLDRIAEAFKLNPSYLSRYFKEQTGMNYVEYLAMLRIKNAKNLLVASPRQKIHEIGIQVGFSGKETFIRTFKRFEGVTPGTYRKRALSQTEV